MQNLNDREFLNHIADYNADHGPDGWPAIEMWKLNRLRELAERYRSALIGAVKRGCDCDHCLRLTMTAIKDALKG